MAHMPLRGVFSTMSKGITSPEIRLRVALNTTSKMFEKAYIIGLGFRV